MTILPGHAPAGAQPPAELPAPAPPADGRNGPDGPATPGPGGRRIPRRWVAAAVVLLLVVAGGSYYLVHASSPVPVQTFTAVRHAATPTQPAPAHHPTSSVARDRSYAAAVFSVLPGQLSGWQPKGRMHVQRPGAATPAQRRQTRAAERCAGTRFPTSTAATSPAYGSGAFGRYGVAGQGEVDFFRSAAAARRNVALMSDPTALRCVQGTANRVLGSPGPGVKYSSLSLRPLRVRGLTGARGVQGTGFMDTAAGRHSLRIVFIEVPLGRRGIEYNSFGVGRAQTVASDVEVLKALVAAAKAQP